MSSTKKRTAPRPPTNGVSSSMKSKESANSSNGSASVGDEFIDKTIELTVVLPNQSQDKIHIVPSTALFDLRTQLCGKYKLNPSSHKLEPVDKNGRAITCTSSSTIESTEAVAVHLIQKIKEIPKITPIKTVEQTVRLTVKTSQSHQQVVRVKPNVPLRTLLAVILDKTNISKEHQMYLELRHPVKTKEILDLSKSLDEYNKLREVFVVDTRVHVDSDAETVSIHVADRHASVARDGSTKKKKRMKSLFKFGKKKSKGQIASPTSTSPPAPTTGAPEFFNEKGVDVDIETLESKRASLLKRSSTHQSDSLHGEVSGKTQEKTAYAKGSTESLNEEDPDAKKNPASPPARPMAPPRIKSRATSAATRPHTTGKKKAPAPPTPKSPEQSSPSSPTARPEKPPRLQSIEKHKSVSESPPPDDEVKDGSQQDVDAGAIPSAAIAAKIDAKSADDVSISSFEDAEIEIVGEKTNQVLDAIKIAEEEKDEKAVTATEEAVSITKAASDHESITEYSGKDDAVFREEEIHEETEEVIKVEEPVAMISSENVDPIDEVNEKQEVPNAPNNAEHHVITPAFGLAVNKMITEDDLQDISDSEIPVVVDDESDTDDTEPNRGEDSKTDAVEANTAPPPPVNLEEDKPVTSPATQKYELTEPIRIEVGKALLPPFAQNEEASKIIAAADEPSPTLKDPTPTPVVTQEVTTQPQQTVVERNSDVTEEKPHPPLLNDDDNLFTTPSDYNVYEEAEEDMASIETQALAMLQQFTTTGTPADEPPPVVDEIVPAETVTKAELKVPTPSSASKEVVTASIPAKKTEIKAAAPKQDADESKDEQTKEEIAKLKAELEQAKLKLAQRDAEAEYARKNPYTIVPEQTSSEAGKRKTFTFLPTHRPARSFEDYDTAPQTVISITNGGDIRGMVLVKDKKPEEKTEEKMSASIEKTVPTVTTSFSNLAPNVVEQPRSKVSVPAINKAPASSTNVNNYPRSNDAASKNMKPPTVASIMVDHLETKSPPRQEIPDVKIVSSQITGQATAQPSQTTFQPKSDAAARKPAKVAGGYVGSAILKQPAAVNSKPEVPSVYDWTSNKKSILPNYYKRFLGIDAVVGTNKAVDKFKSSVGENSNDPIKKPGASNQENVVNQPTTPSSPTKPAVATKPVSLNVKSNPTRQSSSSAIAATLNKALNPSPVTSLPLPPEEKKSAVNNYRIDETPLPPPPEEFLSPSITIPSKEEQPATLQSPTSPISASLTPSYIGISSAKPFGSSASGGPKFRAMSAAFKSGKTNKASSP